MIQFPEKLEFLFQPARYKVAYGGRGSAKSWGFARALLILGAQRPLRIMCTREVQNSIADSVHKLLSDQIGMLGLGYFYEVTEKAIRGLNGTEFGFAGLRQQNVHNLKSYEGADIAWVEEGQSVSKRSWNILTPTIRKPGSEIWVSFNPELDTDETWLRFVEHRPAGAVVVEMNWRDNPWFPAELEAERQDTLKRNPDDYDNIWEGKPRRSVPGAIYVKEIDRLISDGRVRAVPYDPKLKVHTIWDLGWNDSMSIIFVQRHMSEIRVVDFLEDSHRTLDDYAAELNAKRYNYGTDWLPHDGDTRDFKTGRSAREILTDMGRTVQIVPNVGVEPGIKAARTIFGQCYFDDVRCKALVDHLKRYRRNIPSTTGEPGTPVHDEHSHAADAFRYLALVVEQMTNDDGWAKPIHYESRGIV